MSANNKLAAVFSGPCDGSCCRDQPTGCTHRNSCNWHLYGDTAEGDA